MRKLYTTEQVGEILGLDRKSVISKITKKELVGIWIGSQWRVEPAALEKYIADRRSVEDKVDEEV